VCARGGALAGPLSSSGASPGVVVAVALAAVVIVIVIVIVIVGHWVILFLCVAAQAA